MTISVRQPAARAGDLHACPIVTPAPHVGGQINVSSESNVWIAKQPAATLGETAICSGAIDKIISGSASVFISGKPAARQGDLCLHGGSIVAGCNEVLIGGIACIKSGTDETSYVSMTIRIEKLQALSDQNFRLMRASPNADPAKKYQRPRPTRRDNIFNDAIENAKTLLEEKLKSMIINDRRTMKQFKKWFGNTDDWSIREIIVRIHKEIKIIQSVTISNYRIIGDPDAVKREFARTIAFDDTHTIYLGDLFWKARKTGKHTRAGILIHELSHDHNIGSTQDFAYSEEDCLYLAAHYPDHALRNADNYELFMES